MIPFFFVATTALIITMAMMVEYFQNLSILVPVLYKQDDFLFVFLAIGDDALSA